MNCGGSVALPGKRTCSKARKVLSLIANMSTSREFLAHPKYKDAPASEIPAGLKRSQALDLSHGLAGFAKSVSDIQHAYTRSRTDIVRYIDELREVGDCI